MPRHRRQMDLSGRRLDLGASVKAMANGLGMTVADIVGIERNGAADSRLDLYLAWLGRMESWSCGKRKRELRAAENDGRRFAP